MVKRSENKRVLVTGGTNGIGRAGVRTLVRDGASVVATGISAERIGICAQSVLTSWSCTTGCVQLPVEFRALGGVRGPVPAHAAAASSSGVVVSVVDEAAPTRRVTASRSGKIPTTSVRRRLSRLSRSFGLFDHLAPHLFGEAGEGEDVGAGTKEVRKPSATPACRHRRHLHLRHLRTTT